MTERYNPHPKLYGIEMALIKSRQAIRQGQLNNAINQLEIIEELASGLISDTIHFTKAVPERLK